MPPAGIGRQILDTAIAEVGQANRIGGGSLSERTANNHCKIARLFIKRAKYLCGNQPEMAVFRKISF